MKEDPLKGKANPKDGLYDKDQFKYYLTHCKNSGETFTVFLLNICNVKKINEVYGWTFGDAFIGKAMGIGKSWFSDPQSKVFKTFGDKLHVVKTSCNSEQAQKIRHSLNESQGNSFFKLGESEERIHISIGYASSDITPHIEMLRQADLSENLDKILWYREHPEEEYNRYHNPTDIILSSQTLTRERNFDREIGERLARNKILKAHRLIMNIEHGQLTPKVVDDLNQLVDLIHKVLT